jgi:predicted enzyme related to lactoylglutathione lyase
VAKAKALGAKICKDVTTLPMGRFAIISDPQGAGIGLWEFAKQA